MKKRNTHIKKTEFLRFFTSSPSLSACKIQSSLDRFSSADSDLLAEFLDSLLPESLTPLKQLYRCDESGTASSPLVHMTPYLIIDKMTNE
jgi:hypothetical protein